MRVLIAYRPDIDGLRAVAIVSVVIFHANPALLPGGFTGVDVFFVISGYIITRIILKDLEEGSFSFFDFWLRRAKRILPALLFMLSVTAVAASAVILPNELRAYGRLLFNSVLFIANFHLAEEKGYFDPEDQDNPLLHVWSLSVEEQYYLLWPALLVLAARKLNFRTRLAALGLLIGVSLGLSEWATYAYPKQAYYNIVSRAFELLIGASVALYGSQVPLSRPLAQGLSIAGAGLIGASFFFISEHIRFPGFAALLPCLGAALLVVSGPFGTTAASLLSSRPMVGIGKISYSWYLWHWPPLALLRYYLGRPLTLTEIVAMLVLGIAMALLSWRYIERPFRAASVAPRFTRRFIPATLALSLVLIGMATAIKETKGLPGRLSNEAAALHKTFTGTRDQECRGKFRRVSVVKECDFGEDATDRASILLWGDSHARHYLPAIDRIAAAQGVRGLARIHSGCQPYIAPEDVPRQKSSCKTANEQTFALLTSRPEISVVVLAGRWDAPEIISGEELDLPIFRKNLIKTINTLQLLGKKIIFLEQVPQVPFNVDDCLLRRAQFNQRSRDCDAYPAAMIDKYELAIRDVFKELKGLYRNVEFFSPFENFCRDGICRTTDQSRASLYRDNNHLSGLGAYFLTPHIAAAIGPLLSKSEPPLITSATR